MRTFDIHVAKAQLSRLVDDKPLVKVVPVDSPKAKRRIGFMEGEVALPEDFDAMDAEIARLFGGVGHSRRKEN